MKKSFVYPIICAICAFIVALPATGCGDSSPGGISFPDPGLEAAIRAWIDKPSGPICEADLEDLTYLRALSHDISDITGIEYCTNLQQLELGWNQITDFSALTSLPNLQSLDLRYDNISDISWLSGLTNLQCLYLENNQISDISVLAGFTELLYLDLDNNQIIDISALQSLTNLYHLEMRNNQITDIEPLYNNSGISSGDSVNIVGNPLNEASINEYIPELEARGVEVIYSEN